jgi:hypothetical protein
MGPKYKQLCQSVLLELEFHILVFHFWKLDFNRGTKSLKIIGCSTISSTYITQFTFDFWESLI